MLPVAKSRPPRRRGPGIRACAHLSEIIRDGSSVRRQTKGNDLRCHDRPSTRDGKGRREYAYTPERPSAVFLLGCTRHRNGDCGCEPFHLNVVARMGASSVYRAQNPAMVAPGGVLLLTLTRGSRESAPPEPPPRPLSWVPKSLGEFRSIELQFSAETAEAWPIPPQSMSSDGRAFKSASLVTPFGLVQP